MAVPAAIPSIAQQEMAVNAKIARHQEKGRVFAAEPEEARDQWESFKTAAKDFGIGLPANLFGMPADLVGMVTMAGYSGLNWAKGGDFTMIDFTDIPGTSEHIGEFLGADTKSGAFLASAFANPEGALLKGAAVGKAMVIGARALEDVTQGTLASAKGMERLGRNTDDIWKETGWYKQDDDWKFILSDEGSVVHGDKVKDLLAGKAARVGEGGTISGTLGSLFQHDALYKAYPQLRDVPVHFDFIRVADDVDGKAVFEMSSTRQRSISGQTATTLSGPEVTIFKTDGDLGRETLLHEVQHLVQEIEGFERGASSTKWMNRINAASDAHADQIITRDIASGKINLDNIFKEETYYKYLGDLSEQTGIPAEKLEKSIFEWMRPGVDLDAAVHQAEAWAQTTKRDVRIMMEELSKGLSEADQIKLADALTDGLTYSDAMDLTHSRYTRQAGEIEARMTQTLRDTSQEALAKMASPTELADVPAAQRITGDAAKVTREATLDDILIP